MAYVKTVWETGDVITAEKLNNAESGIEASAESVVLHTVYVDTDAYLDITAGELSAAVLSGASVIVIDMDGENMYVNILVAHSIEGGAYSFTFNGGTMYVASDAADRPALVQSGGGGQG